MSKTLYILVLIALQLGLGAYAISGGVGALLVALCINAVTALYVTKYLMLFATLPERVLASIKGA